MSIVSSALSYCCVASSLAVSYASVLTIRSSHAFSNSMFTHSSLMPVPISVQSNRSWDRKNSVQVATTASSHGVSGSSSYHSSDADVRLQSPPEMVLGCMISARDMPMSAKISSGDFCHWYFEMSIPSHLKKVSLYVLRASARSASRVRFSARV